MQIDVWQGDITELRDVDAIVNAANSALAQGGGVCGAIFRAAGSGELRKACNAIGGCSTGDAVVTPSFRLAERGIRWIVHAVGPVYDRSDPEGSAEQLASAYRRSLEAAAAAGARSIAFPAISAGIYGYPPEEAAQVAVSVLRDYDGPMERVVLTAFDDHWSERWKRALGAT